MYNKYFTMKRSELKEAIKAEITSVLSENESKSAVHSLGKDLYDYMTNVAKMKGSLSSPIKADTINKGQQFTVLINDNGGKFGIVSLRIPVGKDNINKEYIQKNIVDQVKRKYKELETKITQIDSTGNNKAMVDFTLTGPNLFQKVTEQSDNPNFDKKVASFAKKINNEMDYPGGVLEAMKQIKSRLERIISKVEGAKRGGAEEEPLMKMIGLSEGTWSLGKASDINIILSQLQDLSKKAYNIIGDDEFYNGIDAAITRAEELMMNAPLNEEKDEDDKAAEQDAKKEKDFANKQKEVDKLKKELADNKDKLIKIAKISRNERTKAQQNLLDNMAKKTKELKKLKRVEI